MSQFYCSTGEVATTTISSNTRGRTRRRRLCVRSAVWRCESLNASTSEICALRAESGRQKRSQSPLPSATWRQSTARLQLAVGGLVETRKAATTAASEFFAGVFARNFCRKMWCAQFLLLLVAHIQTPPRVASRARSNFRGRVYESSLLTCTHFWLVANDNRAQN